MLDKIIQFIIPQVNKLNNCIYFQNAELFIFWPNLPVLQFLHYNHHRSQWLPADDWPQGHFLINVCVVVLTFFSELTDVLKKINTQFMKYYQHSAMILTDFFQILWVLPGNYLFAPVVLGITNNKIIIKLPSPSSTT